MQLDAARLAKAGPVIFAALVAIVAFVVTWVKTRRPEYGPEEPQLSERAEEEIILRSLEPSGRAEEETVLRSLEPK